MTDTARLGLRFMDQASFTSAVLTLLACKHGHRFTVNKDQRSIHASLDALNELGVGSFSIADDGAWWSHPTPEAKDKFEPFFPKRELPEGWKRVTSDRREDYFPEQPGAPLMWQVAPAHDPEMKTCGCMPKTAIFRGHWMVKVAAPVSNTPLTTVFESVEGYIGNRPHSRACGIWPHDHGERCSSDCPTCGGSDRG